MFYYMQKSTGVLVRVTESVQDLDLFTLFGNPTTPKVWTLLINEGVVVSASTTANAAIYGSSNLPTGSILKIVNNGAIIGKGGSSALLYSTPENPYISGAAGLFGLPGGSSISLSCKTYISNSSGYLFGGGGGGGGVALIIGVNPSYGPYWGAVLGGGGAGGGISNNTPRFGLPGTSPFYTIIGQNGTSGLSGTFGIGGTNTYSPYNIIAGSGGSYGENGNSLIIDMTSDYSCPGGVAGAAVSPNGFQLTFLSGLTSSRVKGSYN